MVFCDSGIVVNDHFVLCKAALVFGVTRWVFFCAQKLVKQYYMHMFSWSFDYNEPTSQSSSAVHHDHSSSALAMVKDCLSLTTFENIKQRLPEEESHDMSCAVCLKRFKKNDQVWELNNCRHVFHKQCLDRWLLYDARLTCPLCRTSLTTMSSSESCSMPQQQQPSWAVERILYLFGDDLLCSSSYSSGVEDLSY